MIGQKLILLSLRYHEGGILSRVYCPLSWCACAARVTLSVSVCDDAYSGTTGYEAAIQNYASLKNKRAFFLKRLRSRDMP